jgi:hypothetical protein
MAVTRINNNQITDAVQGNVYVGINANTKLQNYSITSGKIANNLTYGSDLTVTGNLTVQGNSTAIDTTITTIEDPVIVLASTQTGSPAVDIGFIGERGTSENIAFVWDESAQEFVTAFTNTSETNTTINITGYANARVGNMVVGGTTSLAGNVIGAANFTGTVTGGNLLTPGLISATGNITGGNVQTGGLITATGNVTGGNLITGGLITATGNVTGGNILTGGLISATGNVTGGNVIAGNAVIGNISLSGDINVANVTASGYVSVIGNVIGGNLITSALVQGATVSATGNLVGGNANITNAVNSSTVSASGNITGGNILTGGLISASSNITSSANITGGNILTGGLISATSNITGGNLVSATVTNPTAMTISTNAGNINIEPAGNIVVNNTYINGLQLTPIQDADAASKYYVDTIATTGITIHQAVLAATISNLAVATGGTVTYAQPNGVANGIGATLTTTGAFTTIDTASINTPGTRILVKDQANAVQNGVYVYSNTTVITRSTDTDQYGADSAESFSINDYFFTTSGNINAGTAFVVSAPPGVITFGTSNISFGVFSQSQVYSANTSAGLSLNGTVFSAKVDNNTTAFDGLGNISVKVGANLTTPNIGAATGTSLSVTGTVTAASTVGGIITGSSASLSGNVNAGNVQTGGLVSATGNITGGNILSGGLGSFTGNVTAANFFGNIVGNVDAAGANTQVQFNDTGDILGASSGFTFDKAANLLTVGGQITSTGPGNATTGGGQIFLNGATNNRIDYNTNGTGAPAFTTRSAGTKVTLFPALSGSTTDYALGIDSATMWSSIPEATTGFKFKWYGATTEVANLTGTGVFSAVSNVNSGGNISATGNVTGANLILTTGIIDGPAAGRITINGSDIDTDFAVDGDTLANVFYVDAGTGTASFGTSTQTTNAIVAFNTSTSILFPVGNTQQRPATGVTGMLRFNTTNNAVEVYDNTEWTSVGVPVFTVIDDQQFNGDGSTVAFTLSSTQTTNSCIVSINGVVQIPILAYAVAGTDPTCVLTFTEAPEPGDIIDVRQITTTTTVISIANSSGNAVIAVSDTSKTINMTGDLQVSGNVSVLGNIATDLILNGTSRIEIPDPNGNIHFDVNSANDIMNIGQFNVVFTSNIIPSANVTYNLGTATNRWNDLYLANSTIYLGNAQISANATAIVMTNPAGGQTVLAGATTSSSVAGNITGGNVLTGGIVSATGNITGGNIIGGNIRTSGTVSATGAITTGADLSLTGNIVDAAALTITTGSNGNITLAPNGSGVVIVNTDLRNGQANGVGNIGASGASFNTIFAKATSAQYADLAEKYTADAEYAPGTVVVFGGTAEVTVNAVDADRRVAGVVSTNPSYIMNSELQSEFVSTVALTGRVPTLVVGTVKKGDMMVAAGLGRARAEANPQVGTVIGKALEDFDGAEGTIEVVVGRF